MAFDELPHHAGWYRDPESIGERWWNGSQWTSHTRPDAFADGAVSLDGLPPKAWSAADWTTTDAPPVTALQPTALPPVAAYPPENGSSDRLDIGEVTFWERTKLTDLD